MPLLYERFPRLGDSLPHIELGRRPTPVRRLVALEGRARGSAEIWLKDDGVFGGAWGGNKARKLEWILPDVRRRRRRTILTVGALGTNHGLATALYAREQGLQTVLALVDQPIDDHVRAQFARIKRSGARVYRTHGALRTVASLPRIYAVHTDWRRLRPPYFLRVGGSSALGALGYVEAALELAEQVERGELPGPAQVVVALGSGGTVAGLVLGFALAGLDTRVVAVQVNDRTPSTRAGSHVWPNGPGDCSSGAAPGSPPCGSPRPTCTSRRAGWGVATVTGPSRPTARSTSPARRA